MLLGNATPSTHDIYLFIHGIKRMKCYETFPVLLFGLEEGAGPMQISAT